MHFAVEPFMGYFALGEEPSGVDRPRLAQAFIVRCKDDKLFAFHLSSLDKFWDALVEAIEGQTLAQDERFSQRLKRIDNYEALNAELNAIFATKTRAEWVERFAKFDVPAAPINTIPDVVSDPQANHLDMFVPLTGRVEGAERTVRPAFSFDGKHATAVRAAPLVDQHSAEIRASLDSNPKAWPELKPEAESVAAAQ